MGTRTHRRDDLSQDMRFRQIYASLNFLHSQIVFFIAIDGSRLQRNFTTVDYRFMMQIHYQMRTQLIRKADTYVAQRIHMIQCMECRKLMKGVRCLIILQSLITRYCVFIYKKGLARGLEHTRSLPRQPSREPTLSSCHRYCSHAAL